MGEGQEGGWRKERRDIQRLVLVPGKSPTEVWGVFGEEGENLWVKLTMRYENGYPVPVKDGDEYKIPKSATVPVMEGFDVQARRATAAYQAVVPEGDNGAAFGGETNSQVSFRACNSIQEIWQMVSTFPGGKMTQRDSRGRATEYDLADAVRQVYEYSQRETVLPEFFIASMPDIGGFKEAVCRIIKADFEWENSFARCGNFDQIIKRVENAVAYNQIFSKIKPSRINVEMIALVTSQRQPLLAYSKDYRVAHLPTGGDCLLVGWLKTLKAMKAQGNRLESIKNLDAYKNLTGRYGLRDAVDRALLQP